MEFFEILAQAINSWGFPILMSLLLLKRIDNQEARHHDEMKAMQQALENNTHAMERYTNSIRQLLDNLHEEASARNI